MKSQRAIFQSALIQLGQYFLLAFIFILPFIVPNASKAGISELESTDELVLLAVGAISNIEESGRSITVNGQVFVFDSQTISILGIDDKVKTVGEDSLRQLESNDHIAVYGEIVEPGLALATLVVEIASEFIDGATPAYLRAIIGKNSLPTAQASSGSTSIDYSASLYSDELSNIAAGSVVEFFGTTFGDLFMASEGMVLSQPQGTRGSGFRGVRGTDDSNVQGTRGSGFRGVRGTRGSGFRGVRGTDDSNVQGTRGSGFRGVR